MTLGVLRISIGPTALASKITEEEIPYFLVFIDAIMYKTKNLYYYKLLQTLISTKGKMICRLNSQDQSDDVSASVHFFVTAIMKPFVVCICKNEVFDDDSLNSFAVAILQQRPVESRCLLSVILLSLPWSSSCRFFCPPKLCCQQGFVCIFRPDLPGRNWYSREQWLLRSDRSCS